MLPMRHDWRHAVCFIYPRQPTKSGGGGGGGGYQCTGKGWLKQSRVPQILNCKAGRLLLPCSCSSSHHLNWLGFEVGDDGGRWPRDGISNGPSGGQIMLISHYASTSRLRRPSGPLKYRTYAPDRICGQTNKYMQSVNRGLM